MELPVAIALAVVAALVTLLLADLAGGVARAKGRSYWLFFALTLLLWFPGLLAALLVRAGDDVPVGAEPSGREKAVAGVLLVLAVLAAAAGVVAALAYAP